MFQHSAAGLLPVIAKPDTGLASTFTTHRSTHVVDPTFASMLQSQLQPGPQVSLDSGAEELTAASEAEVADVARQLESLLLYNLLKEMWATVPDGTLLDTGMAGEFYREMWLEALSDEVCQTANGIGLAEVLTADITRLNR